MVLRAVPPNGLLAPAGAVSVAPVTPLIAEDLLLLLLDDRTGEPVTSHLDLALGAALLADLDLAGAVRVVDRERWWQSARVEVHPDARVDDPVLVEALRRTAAHTLSPDLLVRALAHRARHALAERLVHRGVLTRVDDRVLGLLPRSRWPEADGRHEAAVRERILGVLVQDLRPEPRTAALIALLTRVDRLPPAPDGAGVSRREVRRRARAIMPTVRAATALQDVFDERRSASRD